MKLVFLGFEPGIVLSIVCFQFALFMKFGGVKYQFSVFLEIHVGEKVCENMCMNSHTKRDLDYSLFYSKVSTYHYLLLF